MKITQNVASSSSSSTISSSSSPSSVSTIDTLNHDLNSDFPLSSFFVDLDGEWHDQLVPDEDDEFCNFIMEAFLA